MNTLKYKGYFTKIEYDAESGVLYGKVEGISDLVNFESESSNDIEREFQEAVDEYLEFCKEVGKAPDKTYTGTFNVRISAELHKQLATIAYKQNYSLNQTVEKAIRKYVDENCNFPVTFSNNDLIKQINVQVAEKWDDSKTNYADNILQFNKNSNTNYM